MRASVSPVEVPTEPSRAIGISRPRVCAVPKVSGATKFAGDLYLQGLLHGRPVLSPYAHARILGIDDSAALAVPGVRAVLRAADLPIQGGAGRSAEPLARSEAVFAGQPVALVVADTEAAAEDAAELVFVDYELLDAVVDLLSAMEVDAPLARIEETESESDVAMHGAAGQGAELAEEALSANVVTRTRFAGGDVEAAFARSAAVVEGTFRTAWVHQASLEPQVAIAWPESHGGVAVHSSTQAIFHTRALLARVLGLPLERVRVEGATIGGGFGGKLGLIEPLVAASALALDRPLRVAFTRMEEFAAANPAPAMQYELKVGADAEGRLLAIAARILVDTGAFPETSPAPLAGGRAAGPYRFDAWEVLTYGVRTNRVGSGAYRGPTATQATFALDQVIDELAQRLGIDPVELRTRNAPERGDARIDGTVWPQIGLAEVMIAAEKHPLWSRRGELPADEGIGLAAGLFPGTRQGASARCRLDADGRFTVITGYVDLSGTDTTVAQIAAETLGVLPDDVRITALTDTASAPISGVSGGSMVTYCLGNAVREAAADARRQILAVSAVELETLESDLVIGDGMIFPAGKPDRGLSLEQLGSKLGGFGSPYPPIEGNGSALPPELAPSAAAAIVHVRVDRVTGHVELLDYVAIQDVGRAINPALCEGQMRGGAVQSIGFALFEELAYDTDGQLMSGSFLSYALPRAEHVPPIDCVLVEVPALFGPLGAKGIGESAVAAGAAAIGNAIHAATGVRMRAMPMTPSRVWHALRESDRDEVS